MHTSTSPSLAPLLDLAQVKDGREVYYRKLTSREDEVLQVGGWCVLLELGAVRESDFEAVLGLSHHACIRSRAYAFFNKNLDRTSARRIAEVDADDNGDLEQRLMLANVRADTALMHEVELARYFETGDPAVLKAMADNSASSYGWKVAVPWYVRCIAINPNDLDSSAGVLNLLADAMQLELLAEATALLKALPRQAPFSELFTAVLELLGGDAKSCLGRIEALEERGSKSEPKFSVGALGARYRARALEKLKRYPEAFRAYAQMNAQDAPNYGKGTSYASWAVSYNKLNVPPLPPVERPDVVMMLGFPRSGTTLLENALAAHPKVETFEEILSLQAANVHIERGIAGLTIAAPDSVELFAEARARYYGEIDRLRKNPDAEVLVDKMPVRSIFATFLDRLLPGQKYIFSIRHPYDVAMSCFQQRFKPNPAMANFLNLVDTIKLYDLTMTEWFKVHTMDDTAVHYLKYDDLVTDFETSTRAVLGFVGLDWDPAVLDFARKAEDRATKTPSYQKVRQGLSIGVQSHWKNYEWLFKAKEAEPLTRWAKFFGYETV